jgi:hypothetical protein
MHAARGCPTGSSAGGKMTNWLGRVDNDIEDERRDFYQDSAAACQTNGFFDENKTEKNKNSDTT